MCTLGRKIGFGEAEHTKQTNFTKTSFASHVSLRETQSSVSLRLTAPFKRSLSPQGDGKNMDLKEEELSCPKRYPCASVLAAGR